MTVRAGLLALLGDADKHGYQLKAEFEACTGGLWPLNVGQVYTTLDRLVRDGEVVHAPGPAGERDQKRYRLTAAGREELCAWWREVPGEEPPARDELVVKVLLALEASTERAVEVITAQRTALTEALQRTRRRQRAAGPRSMAADLAAEAIAVHREAALRWLDLCEARIRAERTVARNQPGAQPTNQAKNNVNNQVNNQGGRRR